jgi:hypothetical protein
VEAAVEVLVDTLLQETAQVVAMEQAQQEPRTQAVAEAVELIKLQVFMDLTTKVTLAVQA